MNFTVIVILAVIIAAAICGCEYLLLRHARRTTRIFEEHAKALRLGSARLSHDLTMDVAVWLLRLTDAPQAVAWVRQQVDADQGAYLAQELGPAYETYLLQLHTRYMSRGPKR